MSGQNQPHATTIWDRAMKLGLAYGHGWARHCAALPMAPEDPDDPSEIIDVIRRAERRWEIDRADGLCGKYFELADGALVYWAHAYAQADLTHGVIAVETPSGLARFDFDSGEPIDPPIWLTLQHLPEKAAACLVPVADLLPAVWQAAIYKSLYRSREF